VGEEEANNTNIKYYKYPMERRNWWLAISHQLSAISYQP
jgi:hypothetical protein